MTKSYESKMLSRVRRWRKKAYQEDKAKPISERAREDKKLAQEFGLPLVQTHKAGSPAGKIKFIKKKSEDAINDIPDNLDFIYIDGNHAYEYCKQDMEMYWEKVRTGGLLGGDDLGLHCPGVCRAVGEFILENNLHLITRRCISSFEEWLIIK